MTVAGMWLLVGLLSGIGWLMYARFANGHRESVGTLLLHLLFMSLAGPFTLLCFFGCVAQDHGAGGD